MLCGCLIYLGIPPSRRRLLDIEASTYKSAFIFAKQYKENPIWLPDSIEQIKVNNTWS